MILLTALLMHFSAGRTLPSALSKSKRLLNQEVNNVIWANACTGMEHTTH
jgi:hypothetical protein